MAFVVEVGGRLESSVHICSRHGTPVLACHTAFRTSGTCVHVQTAAHLVMLGHLQMLCWDVLFGETVELHEMQVFERKRKGVGLLIFDRMI